MRRVLVLVSALVVACSAAFSAQSVAADARHLLDRR